MIKVIISHMKVRAFILLVMVSGLESPAVDEVSYPEHLAPLMEQYCLSCHNAEENKGDVDFSGFMSVEQMKQHADLWRLAMELIEDEEMPTKKPLPTPAEREQMIEWIDSVVNDRDWVKHPHPGHVTIPRLTKTEYNNTMRDLIGVDYEPGSDFLEDGEGQSGFDNDRGGLFTTASVIDKYFMAADRVLTAALFTNGEPMRLHWETEDMFMTETSVKPIPFPNETETVGYNILIGQMTMYDSADFPCDGRYRLKVRARQPGEPSAAIFRIDNEPVGRIALQAGEAQVYEMDVWVKGGVRQIAVNRDTGMKMTSPRKSKFRNQHGVHIDWIKIEGPLLPELGELTIFKPLPQTGGEENAIARERLNQFASRAFRRPVQPEETDRYFRLYQMGRQQGQDFFNAMKQAYTGILVSPHFYYRYEELDGNHRDLHGAHRLDPYAFVSRLSYFLWVSMPDEQLFELAASGEIFKPSVLQAEVKRMIKDPRSRDFSEMFLGQWLGFRALGEGIAPDPKLFPMVTPDVVHAAKQEPILLFDSLLRRGGSVSELIASKFTFVNEDLAVLYQFEGLEGKEMQEIQLGDPFRGGLIGMPAILTATSTPVRTSPVLRGVWILEKILGERIPEPPEAVEALPSDGSPLKATTLREELEQHRDKDECRSCHRKIDPIGFGMENFDAIGRFRDMDGRKPIDSSGVMPDGQEVNGAKELREYLLEHRQEDFVKNVIRQLLAFALGRELGVHDQPTVDAIYEQTEPGQFKLKDIVYQIILSYPFQYRNDASLEENPAHETNEI